MTVPVQVPRNQVLISSMQTVLPWTWNLQAENELVVEVQRVSDDSIDLLVLDADYTVDSGGLDNNSGGNITLIGSEDPSTNGDIFTMTRDSILDRSEDYATSGAFLATTINEQLDELTRIDQDQQLTTDATVQKNPGVGDTLDPLIPQMIDKKGLKFVETSPGNFEFQMTEEDVDGALDILTTKGDLLVHNVTVATRLPVGANGLVVVANSANANGLEWAQVDTAGIADSNVTLAKLADIATDSFMGRDTAGTGVPEVLSAATARGVLNVEDGADVTDATNVESAGALMASNNLSDLGTLATAQSNLNVEDGADVTDEANVTDALDGATLSAVTVAGTDKVLVQDISDSDNLKTVTAQSIADLGGGGGAFRGALVRRTTNQVFASSTSSSNIDWDGEEYDTDSIHDNVTNNSRLTVPSGVTRVKLSTNVVWGDNGTGARSVTIRKNGSVFNGGAVDLISAGSSVTVRYHGTTSAVVTVIPGDYFEARVWQNSGGNLSIVTTGPTWFAMEIIE